MKKKLLTLFACCIFASIINAQIVDEWDHLKHSWDFENGDVSDFKGVADGEVPLEVFQYVTFADGNVTLINNGENSDGGWLLLPGESIAINTYTAFSMECWLTPIPDANSEWHTMLFYLGGQTEDDPTVGVYYFFFTPSKLDIYQIRGALNAYDTWNEDGVQQDGGALESPDTLYHCVVTVAPDMLKIYVNGSSIGETTLKEDNLISNLSNDYAYIGRGGYQGDWTWEGTLHKLSLYDIALTEADVQYLYNHPDKDKHQPGNPDAIDDISNQFAPVVYSSDNLLYIKNIKDVNINSVKIYNMIGCKVLETKQCDGQINHNLQPGIYIISLESNLGDYNTKLYIK